MTNIDRNLVEAYKSMYTDVSESKASDAKALNARIRKLKANLDKARAKWEAIADEIKTLEAQKPKTAAQIRKANQTQGSERYREPGKHGPGTGPYGSRG